MDDWLSSLARRVARLECCPLRWGAWTIETVTMGVGAGVGVACCIAHVRVVRGALPVSSILATYPPGSRWKLPR